MENAKTIVSAIVARFVAPNSKAIAAFVATGVVTLLVRLGVDPEVTVGEFVRSLVDGVVAAAVVWFSPANK